MKITVKAYAKINLLLDITGTIPNGYHSLDNVTQSVDCFDIVTVNAEKSDSNTYTVTCDNTDIPTDESNIVYKAADNFSKKAGFKIKAEIDIKKYVPIMGGMGGSSVDAVGVISALERIFPDALDKKQVYEVCEATGADVPVCYKGGTNYTRTDENSSEMTSYETDTNCVFLCVKPDFSCNTKDAYKLYDSKPTKKFSDTSLFLEKLGNTGIIKACENIYNIFTVLYDDKRIAEIKNRLQSLGAVCSELTGSGSVVFGIFCDEQSALKAYNIIKTEYNSVFICHNTKIGYEFIE